MNQKSTSVAALVLNNVALDRKAELIAVVTKNVDMFEVMYEVEWVLKWAKVSRYCKKTWS